MTGERVVGGRGPCPLSYGGEQGVGDHSERRRGLFWGARRRRGARGCGDECKAELVGKVIREQCEKRAKGLREMVFE